MPICSKCDQQSIFVASGFKVCPICKIRQYSIFSAVMISIFTIFSFFSFLMRGSGVIIFAFIISMAVLSFFVLLLVSEIRDYVIWTKTRDKYLPSKEEFRKSLMERNILACNFHANSPSIGKCAVCGSEICLHCSRIRPKTRNSSSTLMCIGHYWEKKRKDLIFYMGLTLIISVIHLILIILFTSHPYFGNPLFVLIFFMVVIPFLTSFVIIFIYFIKLKFTYNKWKLKVELKL